MNIYYSPQNRGGAPALTLSKTGDVLTIDGVDYDFSAVLEGDILPAEAVGSDLVFRDVTRTGGVLMIHILLPINEFSSEAARFPDPIIGATDGAIEVPA